MINIAQYNHQFMTFFFLSYTHKPLFLIQLNRRSDEERNITKQKKNNKIERLFMFITNRQCPVGYKSFY